MSTIYVFAHSLTHSSTSPSPLSTGGVQLFMTPLRMSNILNDADINTIFSNMQLLLGVNMYVPGLSRQSIVPCMHVTTTMVLTGAHMHAGSSTRT
jgi:hypothetical protein